MGQNAHESRLVEHAATAMTAFSTDVVARVNDGHEREAAKKSYLAIAENIQFRL
jgi:hypothetical protein